MILGSGLLTASGKTTLTLYTTRSGTFNPTIVASDTSGITWTWPDGSTYTGGTPSKALAGGTQTIRITFDDPTLVTELNFQSQNMTGTWPLASLAKFTALTRLQAYSNSALNVTGSLADAPAGLTYLNLSGTSSVITGSLADAPAGLTNLYLNSTFSNITGSLADAPAGLTYLYLSGTSSVITGSLADAPAGLTYLNLSGTSSVITGSLADAPAGLTYLNLGGTFSNITGSLADAPAGLTYLYLGSTSSNISGGATAMAAVGIREIRVDSSSTTQANIDDILMRLYTDRASFTYATPVCNVGGTNPDPTGTYADATPPTTGLEYAYKLVVDPDAEGFKKWAITY